MAVNEGLAFGIDLSKYNTSPDGKKKVNFDVIAEHDPYISFIAMRAGISWGYQDPWFSYYFKESQRIGRVRLPYHVLYPGEPPNAQMDNFFRILGDVDYLTIPLVLDVELHHNQSKARITECTEKSMRIINKRTGRIPIIYSRKNWIDEHINVRELPPVHWWLAQYRYSLPYPLFTPEYQSPPPLPKFVKKYLTHQTAMRGKSIGAKAMHYMDYNRWNGTVEDVFRFAGTTQQVPLECPVDGERCPRLFV